MIKVDLTGAAEFFDAAGPDYALASSAHRELDDWPMTGWRQLPQRMQDGGLKPILSLSARIRSQSRALVVVGTGGSYLGARAAVELLRGPAHNELTDMPRLYFVGNSLSPDAYTQVLRTLSDTDFSVNVISRSGSTLESALAFRVFRNLLEERYGAQAARRRVYVTTGENGRLRQQALQEGYELLNAPEDTGGRYSVLSAVGLLPMAVAGLDVVGLIDAAVQAMRDYDQRSPENPVWQYAAARQHLYHRGYGIELLASFCHSFPYMAEWWKQLFGESEGKHGVGLFPASVNYTADLHSMGQYIQDGPRNLFETVVSFAETPSGCPVPFLMGDGDGLNFLAGRDLEDINRMTARAVRSAHIAGGVPNLGITVPSLDETGFAHLVCFFETACAVSGRMLGVDPFDQPGVEAYKADMRALLEKAALR